MLDAKKNMATKAIKSSVSRTVHMLELKSIA